MDDRNAILPRHDPTADDDNPSTRQILMRSNEVPSLGFNEFPEVPGPSSSINTSDNVGLFPQTSEGEGVGVGVGVGNGEEFWDVNCNPLLDPDIWNILYDSTGNEDENVLAGSSGPHGERIGEGNCDIPQSIGFGNPIQLSVWPVPPSPYACSCCHILREIIHTDGLHITNLEIHGRLGIITHAILDKYDFDFSTQNHVYLMYDFCKESLASVKNFLLQYCEYQKWEGYTMIQDPLSIFYEALCVGIDLRQNQNAFSQPTPMASGNDPMTQQQDNPHQQNAENNGPRHPRDDHQENPGPRGESSSGVRAKSSLSTQRERTGKMKLKDFSEYFHLRINDAAKQMGVCPTVIKKKCREAGLSRWPYRKIKGIKRKITLKQQSLISATAEERPHALAEIQMLEEELANILQQLTNRDTRLVNE